MSSQVSNNYDIYMISFSDRTTSNAFNCLLCKKAGADDVSDWQIAKIEEWLAKIKKKKEIANLI